MPMWIHPAAEAGEITSVRSIAVPKERSVIKRELVELIDGLSDDMVGRILNISKAIVLMHKEKRVSWSR